MRKQVIIIACCCLLCGCSSTSNEVVPTEQPDLHEVVTSITWDNKEIDIKSPVSSYQIDGDQLIIYPYNNSDKHITLKKVLISNCRFWDTVEKGFEKENLKKTDRYSIVTNKSGMTYGYMPISKTDAYIATTDTLPSSYAQELLDILCSTNT